MLLDLSVTEKIEKTDVLILPIFEKKSGPHLIHSLEKNTENFCLKTLKEEKFSGKLHQNLLLLHVPDPQIKRILCLGCGDLETFGLSEFKSSIKEVASLIKPYEKAIFAFPDLPAYSCARIGAEGILYALYQFSRYRSEEQKTIPLKKIQFLVKDQKSAEIGLRQGQAVGEAMNYVRDLGNTPGNDLTPEDLAEEARRLAKKSKKISIKVLDEKDLAKKKMLGLLSVGKGSENPPRMILLNYKGGKKTDPHMAFVGKGITFDAGGISIKPWDHMWDMKMDMLGAGTLLGLLKVVVELQLPLNLSITLAAAENLPSGKAYKPGDVIKTYSGKTIEVLNTDAEGRIVLSDAVTYAQELYQPKTLIDIATLTGACIVALGHEYTAAITNHQETCNDIIQAGKEALDEVWQLPLNANFRKLTKSSVADLANIGPKGQAGTILGAAFIEAFVDKNVQWVHLDIAGTAMNKEASGRPLSMLVQYLLNQVK